MSLIFKAKHWQVFSVFMGATFLHQIVEDINELAGAISYLVLISLILGWVLLTGMALRKKAPNGNNIGYRLFIAIGILIIFAFSFFKFLKVMVKHEIEFMQTNLFVIVFLISSFTLIIIFHSYPARMLKSIETEQEIDINDYFVDIFRFLIWPIGIWTIQPRLNKLV